MVCTIVLAAGKGTRMGGNVPKVLRKVKCKTMLEHIVYTAKGLSDKVVVVISEDNKSDIEKLQLNVEYATQKVLNGTASAVLTALTNMHQRDDILVLLGDVPFLKLNTLKKIVEKNNACVILGFVNEDMQNKFGRIKIENDTVKSIIEYSEATIQEKKIQIVNSGILFLKAEYLKYLYEIDNNNSKSEYYLTDIVKILNSHNISVSYEEAPIQECLGANTPEDLALLESL